ncbi:(+)-neomenthol dehydrogenase-like [Prosopis cineraria]|uniref:(+)-neomenthol dehydrogenase-like n=1 Tax=Prosopis cineraria TaxID=364024 RepID=UPI00240F1CE8|nr:(+)-neomenthol dehydrogenase-like [Prosopis cineraria]
MEGEKEIRYAVVTGANKGLGFGICKKLAARGVKVMLTARDDKRGLEAVEKLKEFGVSDFVVFHQLDVTDPSSIASLAHFISTAFGKFDILVNNAAVAGGKISDPDAFIKKRNGAEIDWNEVGFQTYEMAQQCIQTNFHGTQGTVEALLPLLQLSSSPTILNVSSRAGMLKNIQNEWAREVLSDIRSLNKEKLDEVIEEFLEDFKEGSLKMKGWPTFASAYTVSKAAVNAYTRLLATKFPNIHINCVCPGFVKTDMTNNVGTLSVDEASETPANIALSSDGGPSGLFFTKDGVIPF